MYNVKSIHYANGETQIRRYSTPVNSKEPSPYEENYLYNPFDFKRTTMVEDFDELKKPELTPEQQKKQDEENAKRSFNRTKQTIFTLSRCAIWEKFVTFTFNGKLVDRYNFDECSRLVRQWLHNQRRNAPDLQYLIVPELHKDGAIHFHGLLANTSNMKFVDSEKRTKDKKTIYNIGKWKYGFTTAIEVYNTHGVSKYLAKYITKELCDLTKGKHRYFISNNLEQPISELFLLEDADFDIFLKDYANLWGKNIVHVSKPRTPYAYVDVDYYELQEMEITYDSTTSI